MPTLAGPPATLTIAGLRRQLPLLVVLLLISPLAIHALQAPGTGVQTSGRSVADPPRLNFAGEVRVRYETLDGQFRAGRSGGDQLLLFRTLLLAELNAGRFVFGAELQDSRTYLGDSGTPLSTSIVNPLDLLQAYVQIDLSGVAGDASRTVLKLGRQTVSIASQRQIERVSFANVIKNFTGSHLVHTRAGGDRLHLLFVVPLARRPVERARLDSNDLEADREQWGRKIWALHYIRPALVPTLLSNVSGEVFVYGLEESDSDAFPTPNRSYVTTGFRLFRPREPGRLNFDVESALRRGSRRASSAPDDTDDLTVSASMLRAEVGYTLATEWRPNLALQYYWASGDESPGDNRFDQYERLFGGRRTDLNNTSLHGPLTPANLNAPGARLQIRPSDRLDARLTYSAAFLASDTDRWVIAGLRDETGSSGSFVGHVFDGSARIRFLPGRLHGEFGASSLLIGEFGRNASGGTIADRTFFAYSQFTLIL